MSRIKEGFVRADRVYTAWAHVSNWGKTYRGYPPIVIYYCNRYLFASTREIARTIPWLSLVSGSGVCAVCCIRRCVRRCCRDNPKWTKGWGPVIRFGLQPLRLFLIRVCDSVLRPLFPSLLSYISVHSTFLAPWLK